MPEEIIRVSQRHYGNESLESGYTRTVQSGASLVIAAGATFTNGGAAVGGVLNSQFTPSSNTSIGSEDALIAYTLPASLLSANGRGVRVTVGGTFAANGNSKSAKLYFGSTLVAGTNFVVASPNALAWRLTADVVRTGPATQIASSLSGVAAIAAWYTHSVTSAETMSGSIAIQIRGLSATAAADVIANSFMVELL